MPMAVATSMNGVVMVATLNANILKKNKMKQELTKELAAYTATKFLLDVCGENINATATIVDAEAKTYDKGGWNIPDVRWWLDLDLPIINI